MELWDGEARFHSWRNRLHRAFDCRSAGTRPGWFRGRGADRQSRRRRPCRDSAAVGGKSRGDWRCRLLPGIEAGARGLGDRSRRWSGCDRGGGGPPSRLDDGGDRRKRGAETNNGGDPRGRHYRARQQGNARLRRTSRDGRGAGPRGSDRKSVVEGKSGSVRVDLGGRGIIKNKNKKKK